MKSYTLGRAIAGLLLVISSNTLANRPDSHAPIGVMADHGHKKGEWMLSYRTMRMAMDTLIEGSGESLASAELLPEGGYRVMPEDMTMTMHMLGAMYAPSDRLTLMVMLPYLDNEMASQTAMGMSFDTASSGIGDARLGALIQHPSGWLLRAGLSVPTGDQDYQGMTPMGLSTLPFPMQIGSGTWDITLGATKVVSTPTHSFGVQFSATARLGDNDQGYRQGHVFATTAWAAKPVSEKLSASLRFGFQHQGQYAGEHVHYAMAREMSVAPTFFAELQGEQLAQVALGLNSLWSNGHRWAIEYQHPVYEKSNGLRLSHQGNWNIGWQKAF